ncbi:MAG: multicopper oxidase domain-containing protein [Dongiaceae bacterium]
MRLSRRQLLGGAGPALLLPVLLARAGRAETHDHGAGLSPDGIGVRRVPFTPGAPLAEPEVRQSAGGVLETTLRMAYAYRDIGGYRLWVRTYEGMVPGPTLKLRPGDRLKIHLVNDLPPNRDTMPSYPDQPHHLNTTNLHLHGLHVTPSGIGDNVMRSMAPGGTYEVEVEIPADHPAGTYWYHPHHHGSADIQMASGAAGALIIEGDFAGVPEIAAARERLLVLGEAVFDGLGTVEGFETLFPETATRFLTVNGQRAPTIEIRPGEVQRWRLLHAGYQDDLFLQLQGHRLHPIARDGIAMPGLGLGEVRTADHAHDAADGMLIVPGQRIDLLVQGGAPGTYELRALPYDQGYPSPTGLVATVVVRGEPAAMRLPAALPPGPFRDIADHEITNRRQLVFSADTPEAEAAGTWREFRFLIDGKVFDPHRVDQRVRLGAVEEWTIVNKHFHDHIFHIHTNPFQLVRVNGEPVPPVWLDTVVLPRNGSIVFRSRFLDFTGLYMLHCHMMNHEELGMMQVVEVYSGS